MNLWPIVSIVKNRKMVPAIWARRLCGPGEKSAYVVGVGELSGRDMTDAHYLLNDSWRLVIMRYKNLFSGVEAAGCEIS